MNSKTNGAKKGSKAKVGCVFFALFGVFLVWLATRGENSSQAPGPVSSLDASAQIACQDYRRLVRDVNAGILTNEEIRDRMKAIQRNTHLSKSAGIKEAGEAMLRSMTHGDFEDVGEALKAMTAACAEK